MNDGQQWDAMCDEYSAAQARRDAAWKTVVRKFSDIGSGRSNENPTDEEIQRLNEARSELDAIDKRMSAFMKEKFGVDA